MKRIIFLILFLVSLTTIGQTDKEIISSQFKDCEFVKIRIKYHSLVGSTYFYQGRIVISTNGKKFSFGHQSTEKTLRSRFNGIDNGVLDLLIKLETKAKETEICGGTEGGVTTIEMFVNDKRTQFSFCTKRWNGLKEFTDKITTMQISNKKK